MLGRYLAPRAELAYTSLRVVSGFLFAIHGAQKVFGLLGRDPQPFGTQIWLGGVIELVCGIAVALGAWTPWAAFLASGTMAVAYIQFHWKLQGGEQLLPVVNKGELSVVYAFLFLYLACRGSGRWSVDASIPTRR